MAVISNNINLSGQGASIVDKYCQLAIFLSCHLNMQLAQHWPIFSSIKKLLCNIQFYWGAFRMTFPFSLSSFTKIEWCQCFSVDPADTWQRLDSAVYIGYQFVQPVGEWEYLYKIQNTVCPQVATGMSLFSGVKEGPPIEVLHMKARHDRDPSAVRMISSFI